MTIDERDDVVRRLRADAQRRDERLRPITVIEIEQRVSAGHPTDTPRSAARVALAMVVASVVVLAAGVAWTTTRSTHAGPRKVRVLTPATVPKTVSVSVHAEPRTGAPLYLEPSSLPAGFHLVSADGGDPAAGGSSSSGSHETTAAQFWVRFDAARDKATATLGIAWGPGSRALSPNRTAPKSDDPLAGWELGSDKIIVRGRTGWYSRRLSGVAWEEPAGQAVSVSCQQCSRDELVRIANGLEARADGGFMWTHPSDGFEFVNEAPGMASDGTNARQLIYRGPDNTGVHIAIVDDTDDPPFSQLGIPGTAIADVRGTKGVIGPMMNAPLTARGNTGFTPTLFLQWLEYPNVAVTVAGKGIDRAELVAIANGLVEITPQRWSALGGSTPSSTADRTTVRIANDDNGPIVLMPDGRTLVMAVPTCNGAPTARVRETGTAVHVLVTSIANSHLACLDSLSVRLASPLGSRVVIDDKIGRPVAVRR